MTLVFLDTETTGLELHHDIWEAAWAVDDGPVTSLFLSHSLANADPKALELNGYFTRTAGFPEATLTGDLYLREALEGATIVGANPAFDAIRLQLRWGAQPWHYRMIDVSSMAVGVFGHAAFDLESGRPPGMAGVQELLVDYGIEGIPEPDHTAAGDVACLRACYQALLRVRI